jgi:hypothetical protein
MNWAFLIPSLKPNRKGKYMREEISVGTTPVEENCVPAPYKNAKIAESAQQECQRFKQLLETVYPDIPLGARFRIKLCPYDFGAAAAVSGYYDLVVSYNDMDEEAADFAFHVEANTPLTWDDTEIRNWRKIEDMEDVETEEFEIDPDPRLDYTSIDGLLIFDGDYLAIENEDNLFYVASIVDTGIHGYYLCNPEYFHKLNNNRIAYVALVDGNEQLKRWGKILSSQIAKERFPEAFTP